MIDKHVKGTLNGMDLDDGGRERAIMVRIATQFKMGTHGHEKRDDRSVEFLSHYK